MRAEDALLQAKAYTRKSLKEAGALKGQDGKSAYEIAVDNGFEGSEKEWLESLKANNIDITQFDGTEILNTAILEKAVALPIGIYEYKLGGSAYAGADLPNSNYQYSKATINTGGPGSTATVIVWGVRTESKVWPLVVNYYNNGWSGWNTLATTDTVLGLAGGTMNENAKIVIPSDSYGAVIEINDGEEKIQMYADGLYVENSESGETTQVNAGMVSSPVVMSGGKNVICKGDLTAADIIPAPEYIEFYSDDDGYLTIGGIYGRLIDLGNAYIWPVYGGFETVGTTGINPLNFTSDIINSDKVIMGHGMLQFVETEYADGKATVTNMRHVSMSLSKTGFKMSLFNKQEDGMTLHGVVVLLKK